MYYNSPLVSLKTFQLFIGGTKTCIFPFRHSIQSVVSKAKQSKAKKSYPRDKSTKQAIPSLDIQWSSWQYFGHMTFTALSKAKFIYLRMGLTEDRALISLLRVCYVLTLGLRDAQTSSKEGRLQSQHFISQCERNLNTPQIPTV